MLVSITSDSPHAENWLPKNASLVVLGVYCYQKSVAKYLLWSEKNNTAALFPAKEFIINDKQLSRRWVFTIFSNGGVSLEPEIWTKNGFSEKYHDGDSSAEAIFQKEMQLLYEEAKIGVGGR